MSWCGAGEMASVPMGMRLVSDIGVVTFTPGRCPPMPGLAPWPILMTTAWPFESELVSTPNLADAHWTVILLHLATSLRRPPSPVPAIMPVMSAALAIAALGTPDSAPKDMSPRYIGEESTSGEPAAKRVDVSTLMSCLGESVCFRYNWSSALPVLSASGSQSSFVARPVSESCLMWSIFHLVQNSLAFEVGRGM